MASQFRIGIDVGGTFTDGILINEQTGETTITKVPSTPNDPSIGFLKAVKRIEIQVSFNKIDISKEQYLRSIYYSREFEDLYKKCVNYLPPSTNAAITTYPTKYVIIADPMFQSALQGFVEWKTKKGFNIVAGDIISKF